MLNNHSIETNVQKMEWEVFLNQLKKEFRGSEFYSISDNRLILMIGTERTIFEKYGANIRRRVDSKGHEIVLQNIKSVRFEEGANSVCIEIVDMFNQKYFAQLYPFVLAKNYE